MVSFSLSTFLVATAAATATASMTANRRLSYALIAGYEPGSSVTDHVSISTVTVVPAFLVPSSLGCRFAPGGFQYVVVRDQLEREKFPTDITESWGGSIDRNRHAWQC